MLLVVLAVLLVAFLVWAGMYRQMALLRAFGPDASEDDFAAVLRPVIDPVLKFAKPPLKWKDVLPLIKQRMTLDTLLNLLGYAPI